MPRPRAHARALPLLAGLVFVGAFAGCGEEVGRAACEQNQPLSGTATLEANKDAALWADFDADYVDGVEFSYALEVKAEGGEVVTTCEADPTSVNTKINARTSDRGSSHSRRYLGKLECEHFQIDADGPVHIEGSLRVTGAEDASVRSCDVVVRQ